VYNQVRKSTNKRLFALYVDLTAAFDKIPRRYLWAVIEKRTGSTKLTNIMRALYTNNRGNISNSEIWYDIFGGTRQGGVESPPAFVWYFDFVLKVIRHRVSQEFAESGDTMGIKFKYNIDHFLKPKRGDRLYKDKLNNQELITALLFADDLTELSYDFDTLQKILKIMDEECHRFGLYVSFKKTFVQEWPVGKEKPETEPEKPLFSVISSAGVEHEIMNKQIFKALGLNLDNLDPSGFISHRIALATGQFQKYREVLTDYRVRIGVRRKFAESYVRSTLLYGINAECPSEAQIGKLAAIWYYFLRQMSPGGFSKQQNDDGTDNFKPKFTNKDLDKYFKTPPIKEFIYVNYLKYIGHIVRRPNDHPTKRALFIVPDRPHAPSVWTKIRFLFDNKMSREEIIRKMNCRTSFQTLLNRFFPHLRKS